MDPAGMLSGGGYFNPRSHEGSDVIVQSLQSGDFYFNPRSHEGSDGCSCLLSYAPYHFNPRSHEGSDLFCQCTRLQCYYFNPRSHEGSDILFWLWEGTTMSFQSTLPRGERHYDKDNLPDTINISIHAPTRGATPPPHST